MGGMLRHCHYDIWPGQAGHGFKQKISQQGGKVQMPVKLEPKQGVPQGPLIETVESSSAPRRGILKACAADAVASLWIRRRNSAARASGPGVWDKLSPALGAKEGFRRCRGMGVRRKRRGKGTQTVQTAVLVQSQSVLHVGQRRTQPAATSRWVRLGFVIWHGVRNGVQKARSMVCPQHRAGAGSARSWHFLWRACGPSRAPRRAGRPLQQGVRADP